MNELKGKTTRRVVPPAKMLARLRWKTQLLFFILLNFFVFKAWQTSFRSRKICIPVLNCHGCPAAGTWCPIGVIGDKLSLGLVPWIAIGTLGLIGILVGRFSCGWICPFGAFQDLLAKLPVRKWNPPRWTRITKYIVLAGMVIAVPLLFGTDSNLFFCRICPDATIMASGWNWIQTGEPIPLNRVVTLGAFLLLSIFIVRGFCRLFCPIGAALSFFNKVSFLSLRFNKSRCTDCTLCVKDCPTGEGPRKDLRDPECVHCYRCLKCNALAAGFSNTACEQSGPQN